MTDHDADDRRATWQTALSEGRFEEVLAALEEVVEQLEAGQLTLDESVARFELGVRLAQRCDILLDEAELRVTSVDVAGFSPDRTDPDGA